MSRPPTSRRIGSWDQVSEFVDRWIGEKGLDLLER